MYSYEDSKALNVKLSNFLKLTISIFCGRCKSTGDWPHHPGIINNYIKSKKPINNHLDIFYNDTDHGIFHGIMTAFSAYILMSPSNREEFEKLFASCMLHDFVKSINGLKVSDHDKKLKDFFPDLLPETYEHNLQADKHSNTHLICADRLELMRYADYLSWVDDRLEQTLDTLSYADRRIIKLFYTKARPALEHFHINKKSIWISHGIERIDSFNSNSAYPYPYSCHIPSNIQDNDEYKQWVKSTDNIEGEYYPIEHDRYPFTATGKSISTGFCSSHGWNFSWGKLKGLISTETFTKQGGSIIHSNVRDHLYAKSDINIKDWTFVYTNIHDTGKCKYPDITNKEIKKTLVELLNINGIKIIELNNIFYLWTVIKLASDRMALLNLER